MVRPHATRLPPPDLVLLGMALAGLAAGGGCWLAGLAYVAGLCWLAVTVAALLPALWWVVEGLARRQLGTDVIAVLALGGTILVGEYLAGAIIAVMLTGGRALEGRASRRARRDLSGLASLAPRVAHRRDRDSVVQIPVEEVRPGDLLLVRPGEVLPVDGRVEGDAGVVDESTITGEPLPVERARGEAVRSGTLNAGGPFEMRATTDAAGSTYAGIVRLAREAEAGSARFVRLADRYAAVFLPATLALAGAAWGLSGDVVRAVAVLVVATPCPLILAAPIAFVSGLSRSARRGVIVKGGGALERLARAKVLLFDKTGTVTAGRPELIEVVIAGEPGLPVEADEVLRLAASLDQVSSHVLAAAIVSAARARGLSLALPSDVSEVPGQGIRGVVDGRQVAVGKARWLAGGGDGAAWIDDTRARAAGRGAVTVFVGVDGKPAGALLLLDRLRPDAPRTFRMLRHAGIQRAIMITGDRSDVGAAVGEAVGADAVRAELTPADKVAEVRAETAAAPTVMVGDGINDAPALASAGVGVALGARGATVSSQAADVVITVDRLERLAETLAISRRTLRIALQSIAAGMGLSLAAMIAAAFGLIVPVVGAVLQEGIDVAVILNALRALGPGRERVPRLRGDAAELVRRLDEEHRTMRPKVERLRTVADMLDAMDPEALRRELDWLRDFLTRELMPHERDDERLLYPAVARELGGRDPTAIMSREHLEINELIRGFEALADETLRRDGQQRGDLRRTLHELYAVLRLHFAQEEESYFVLAEEPGGDR